MQMTILHLACLNNEPEIYPFLGPKCAPVGGEPHIEMLIFNSIGPTVQQPS